MSDAEVPLPPPPAEPRFPGRDRGIAAALGVGLIALTIVLLTLPAGDAVPERAAPPVQPVRSPADSPAPAAPVAPPAVTLPPPAPPAAVTAPPSSPQTAEIVATALPRGSTLRLDGRTTSRRRITVSPGRHVMEVSLAGFATRIDTQVLSAGQSFIWAPRLAALPTASVVKAQPVPILAPPTRRSNPDDASCRQDMAADNWRDAFPACSRAGEAGSAVAQRSVAVLFQRGDGVRRSDDSAGRWFGQAARNGDLEAMYQLAMASERGRGVAKDQSAALDWYTRAASGGHAGAQYSLGEANEKGRLGLPKDKAKALDWYRKAAAQGLKDAANKVRDLER